MNTFIPGRSEYHIKPQLICTDENESIDRVKLRRPNYLEAINHEAYNSSHSNLSGPDIDLLDNGSNLELLHNINRGRVAIFIDGSNLFYAALQLGIEINYIKLLRLLTAGSRLLRSFFYTGVDPSNDKQQNFLLWMRRNGYRVIAKNITQFPDGSKKADLDVEIAVDMMTLVDHYDTAVLVSGDGDLAYAVNAVSYKGVRVEVVSLRSMTSDTLINCADFYLDIHSIKEKISKSNKDSILG